MSRLDTRYQQDQRQDLQDKQQNQMQSQLHDLLLTRSPISTPYSTTLKRSKTFPPLVRSSAVLHGLKWSQHANQTRSSLDQKQHYAPQAQTQEQGLGQACSHGQPLLHLSVVWDDYSSSGFGNSSGAGCLSQDSANTADTCIDRGLDPICIPQLLAPLSVQSSAEDSVSIARSTSTLPQLHSPPFSPPTSPVSPSMSPELRPTPAADLTCETSPATDTTLPTAIAPPLLRHLRPILRTPQLFSCSAPSVRVDDISVVNVRSQSWIRSHTTGQKMAQKYASTLQHHQQTASLHQSRQPELPRIYSITFAENIERICHFTKTDPPNRITDSDIFDVKDNGNWDLASVSLAYALSETWRIVAKNLPTHSQFRGHSVVLDHVDMDTHDLVRIVVLTRNLAYEKHVSVRCTTDGWKTFHDISAKFQSTVTPTMGEYKGVDRFWAIINLTTEFGTSATTGSIEFAICYKSLGVEYWDNNGSCNYKLRLMRPLLIDCLSRSSLHQPIKAGLEWTDERGNPLAYRRHSIDSSVSSAQAARLAIENLLAAKRHSASTEALRSCLAAARDTHSMSGSTSPLSSSSKTRTQSPTRSNTNVCLAPPSPPPACTHTAAFSKPSTSLFLPSALPSTFLPSQLPPPQVVGSLATQPGMARDQHIQIPTSIPSPEIPLCNTYSSRAASLHPAYPSVTSLSYSLMHSSTEPASTSTNRDLNSGVCYPSSVAPVPIVYGPRNTRDLSYVNGFAAASPAETLMVPKMSCSPPCRV
ncbi:hypothetical protein BSLG_006441 [Batrachochytrium salamandrivorans]|nr:hypothetical protein BSLG_006441 [Batrachochytrium salamandrivorans]